MKNKYKFMKNVKGDELENLKQIQINHFKYRLNTNHPHI